MAPSDSVGLRSVPAVRAALRRLDDAVFRRESFFCGWVGFDRLSPVADSLRLSAGGACPSRAASDALCRSAMRLRGFHLPMPRPTLPKEYRACRVSQSRSTACRLKLAISRLRTPSIGLIPTEAGMSAGHKLICQRPHSARTLATRSSFPPVTVMGRRVALVYRVPFSPKRARPTPHKMLLTNLCNRLVVNEHPWDPPTRERPTCIGLTSPVIAALCPARPCWGLNSETPERRRVALWAPPESSGPEASSTSRDVAIGTAHASRDRSLPVTRRPPPFCFGRRQPTRWRSLPLREPDSEVTDTPCRSTRHAPAFAHAVVWSQGPLHEWRTTATAS